MKAERRVVRKAHIERKAMRESRLRVSGIVLGSIIEVIGFHICVEVIKPVGVRFKLF